MPDRKDPFDVAEALRRAQSAVSDRPPAAMFALADEGYSSLFEQLVACILSTRTYDEVSLPTARRLFAVARTPQQLAALSVEQIDTLIRASTFHEAKAPQLQALARRVVSEFGGELPKDVDILRSFRGVGPKCAHLALGVALGRPYISVDVHVHRVTNRWGYVRTTSPEQTLMALEAKLPKQHWIEINRVLVPFGKHVCTGKRPHCSTCPVLSLCRQVGVTEHS
jgi:endonuclease-3